MKFSKKWGYYEMIISLSKSRIWGNYFESRNLNIIEALEYLSYEKELGDLKESAQKEAENKSKTNRR
tara:strand:+ start:411 stop:611 length:201 start_codon:yes stop_codon:yes gene_type:complete